MKGRVTNRIKALLAYGWGYMGTLAAMGMLIGVLGMGIYHACTRDAEYQAIRYFGGVFNSADATPPTGLDELPNGSATPAVPHLRFEYGEGGRLKRMVHVSADGHPSAIPGSKVCEQRIEYDTEGRLTRKSNYTATGAPATDASGVHARVFAYDDAGRLTRTEYLDRSGHLIVPRMPGYAVESIQYDGKGRPATVEYLDGQGKPVTNARGERRVVYTYDDEHHTQTRTNYIGGQPADDTHGIACEQTNSSADGSTRMTMWYNAEGHQVAHPKVGAVSMLTEVSQDGSLRRERLCEADGTPCHSAGNYVEHMVRTTPGGLVEWECYNDVNGLPCVNEALGYAERVCEYGADGALMGEYFWDASGSPCPLYEQRYATASDGRHMICLHTDGSTEARKANGK